MQISSVLLTASAASAISLQPNHHMASMAFGKLKSRQSNIRKPIHPPYSCEKSCGEGLEACRRFPNRYNPTEGALMEVNILFSPCANELRYCPRGPFCAETGCCPKGRPLSKCSASKCLTASTATGLTPSFFPGSGAGDDLPNFSTPSTSPPDDSGAALTRHLHGNPIFGVANKISAQPGWIAAGLGLLSFV